MPVINHDYDPKDNAAQMSFHNSGHRYKGFKGSKGSGKTRALVEECIALCYEFPGNRGIIARLDLGDLKETTMQFFFDYCPEELIIQRNRADHFVVMRSKDPNKPSRIKFAHCKDPKSFESGEIGFFALDEADEIPLITFKTLRTRLRLKGITPYGLLAFNPTDRFHWIYRFFVKDIDEKPSRSETRKLFSNNTWDNLSNLPEDYIDELRDTYTGDDLNRFLYGEWGSLSNEWAVWPEFRESVHVAKKPIEVDRGLPILRAHDFGMTAACSFHQFVSGQWRVLHPEIMEFGKGAEQFAPIVNQVSFENFKDNAFMDVSEPFAKARSSADASKTCVKAYDGHNIKLKIRKDDWQARTGAVSYFMTRLNEGEPTMQVDPRNEVMITGLCGGYQYEENARERTAWYVKDNEFTHLCDTLQMAACEFRGRVGGQVKTPRGPRYRFGTRIPAHKVIRGQTVAK